MIGFNWMLLFEAYRYTTIAVATLCFFRKHIKTASSNSCIFFPPSSLFLLRNRSVPSQLLFYIKYTVYTAFVQDFFQIPALLFSSSEPEGPHFSEITFHTPFSR